MHAYRLSAPFVDIQQVVKAEMVVVDYDEDEAPGRVALTLTSLAGLGTAVGAVAVVATMLQRRKKAMLHHCCYYLWKHTCQQTTL